MSETKFRQCYVLRETKIDMADLKRGDVFRLEKADDSDCVIEEQWSIAESDAKPTPPPGNSIIEATPIEFAKVITSKVSLAKKGD